VCEIHALAVPAGQQTAGPDFAGVKNKQKATWASGDFAVIGTTLQIVGESLAEAVDVRAGERVVDVAAGNGNATLAAARRFADVTSTDYVAALLEKGKARAEAEGLNIAFEVADAEALPFANSSFGRRAFHLRRDVRAGPRARRLRDVTRSPRRRSDRPGELDPRGFHRAAIQSCRTYLPPPAGLKSPALWGTEPHLVALFGSQADDIRCVRKHFNFRYRSTAHWIQVFREFYGPTLKAFAALDSANQAALEQDITSLLERFNRAGKDSLVVPGEYLEAVIVKR
jgi:SAM-dependent methyltransferase